MEQCDATAAWLCYLLVCWSVAHQRSCWPRFDQDAADKRESTHRVRTLRSVVAVRRLREVPLLTGLGCLAVVVVTDRCTLVVGSCARVPVNVRVCQCRRFCRCGCHCADVWMCFSDCSCGCGHVVAVHRRVRRCARQSWKWTCAARCTLVAPHTRSPARTTPPRQRFVQQQTAKRRCRRV